MLYFSIVVPVHNRAHTLKKCVDSILAQTYKDFELILVDDHSTDLSLKIAEEFAAKDSRVRVILQNDEKHGAQAARNMGIKNAKYNWIMFNDSDDVWHNDKIEKELLVLEKNNFNEQIVIYSDCFTIDINTNEKKYWSLPHISEKNSYADLLIQSAPMFQSIVCSKKHLEAIGYLDENVPSYQEWDTSIRLSKNGRFIQIKEPLFDYYIGAEDAISKSVEKDFIGRCYIYNKFKDEIIKTHGEKQYKRMMALCFSNAKDNVDFEILKKQNQIIKKYEDNLIELFGKNYKKNINKLSKDLLLKRLLLKIKRIIKALFNIPYFMIKKFNYRYCALKNNVPIVITPILNNGSKQYLYQLSFFSEFSQYFNSKLASIHGTLGKKKMFYDLKFAFFPVKYSFEEYFKVCIKSPERAMIRKAIKNGYTCAKINYDDYLDDILLINTSKLSRQGEKMAYDYVKELKPREKIVSSIGQKVFSYGCFDGNNKLVAYYMFELYGNNILHTVKGIGHSEHLNFGIMNYLFAFSVGELFNVFSDGTCVILYGGIDENGGGLSRFKKNVGCKIGSPTIFAEKQFYKDLKKFNKKYKIHGDTGLNFILDYLKV